MERWWLKPSPIFTNEANNSNYVVLVSSNIIGNWNLDKYSNEFILHSKIRKEVHNSTHISYFDP